MSVKKLLLDLGEPPSFLDSFDRPFDIIRPAQPGKLRFTAVEAHR
jgi:hypothetical protein